jgi:hypothetical protein
MRKKHRFLGLRVGRILNGVPMKTPTLRQRNVLTHTEPEGAEQKHTIDTNMQKRNKETELPEPEAT